MKKVANDIEMAMTWLVDGLVDFEINFHELLYIASQ